MKIDYHKVKHRVVVYESVAQCYSLLKRNGIGPHLFGLIEDIINKINFSIYKCPAVSCQVLDDEVVLVWTGSKGVLKISINRFTYQCVINFSNDRKDVSPFTSSETRDILGKNGNPEKQHFFDVPKYFIKKIAEPETFELFQPIINVDIFSGDLNLSGTIVINGKKMIYELIDITEYSNIRLYGIRKPTIKDFLAKMLTRSKRINWRLLHIVLKTREILVSKKIDYFGFSYKDYNIVNKNATFDAYFIVEK